MKKRKILVLFPFLGLLLSGCSVDGVMAKAKDILSQYIYQPIKGLIDGGSKEDDSGKDTPAEKTLSSIAVTKHPEEVKVGEAIDKNEVKLTLTYSDESKEENVAAEEVVCDTSKAAKGVEATAKYKDKTATFKIDVVEDKPPVNPEHAGTAEDPYTGADAAIVASTLDADKATTDSFYIEGIVKEFKEEFKEDFGNYSFEIDGGFVGWRLKKGPQLDMFSDGDLKVGDTVTIYCKIQNYKGTTPESKDGYIYKINGEKQGEDVPPIDPSVLTERVTFELGENGDAAHADGSATTTYTETVKDVTLQITDGEKMYKGARDARGNGCLKFGTSSVNGSFKINVADVSGLKKVVFNVANYKSTTGAKISIDGGEQVAISGKSDAGEYDAVEAVVTSGTVVVAFTGRAMLNSIEFLPAESVVGVESVTLAQQSFAMDLGDPDVQLSATVSPENATDSSVIWSSSKEEVATVSNGLVHAVGVGEATITVASVDNPEAKDSLVVTVSETEKVLQTVTVTAMPKTEYTEGELLDLTGMEVTLTYDQGEPIVITSGYETNIALDHKLTLEDTSLVVSFGGLSAKPITLTINEKAHPTHAGTLADPYTVSDAKIIFDDLADGAISSECYVTGTIAENPVPKISSGRGQFYLTDGSETDLYVYNINNIGGSNNLALADIPAGSAVVAKGGIKNYGGTFELCYNKENPAIACELISVVKPTVLVSEIQLTSTEENLVVGLADLVLGATVLPENASNKSLEWSSSDETVATVENGVVHAVAEGNAVITAAATDGSGIEATCTVHVSVPTKEIVSVQIKTMPKVEYNEGDKLDLSDLVLTLYYDDSSTEDVTTGYTTNIALNHELTTEDTELIITYGEFGLQPITLTIIAKPQPTHAGTAEDPYTIKDCEIVYANANLDTGKDIGAEVYVAGTIVADPAPAIASGRGKVYISDSSSENTLYIHQANNIGGTNDLTLADIPAGSEIVAKGTLKNYNGAMQMCYVKDVASCEFISIVKPVIAPETIEITSGSEVAVGGTLTLAATVGPVGASQDVDWNIVSGGDYATLSDGVLTGVAAGDVVVKATATGYESVTTQKTISVTADTPVTISDELTRATTGVTGTSYTEWSGKSVNSTAVYAGQSAGGNESIQLRSKNSNSGIVTTASGGTLKKIIVVWNSNTQANNKIDIYGDTSAYSSPTQLYGTPKGTKLGSIEMGVSTELEISGEYTFVGVRSNNNAVYLTSITFVWG